MEKYEVDTPCVVASASTPTEAKGDHESCMNKGFRNWLNVAVVSDTCDDVTTQTSEAFVAAFNEDCQEGGWLPVSGEDLGIPLVGVMDLVLPEEAGPIITDFKTASKSSGPLEISHEVQLSCYSYLFRQATPGPEAGLEIRSLVKTKTPQMQKTIYQFSLRSREFPRVELLVR